MVKTVLVTGGTGFIGRNTIKTLEANNYNILQSDSNTPEAELQKKVLEADFIVHLAGVNRPKNTSDFYIGNTDLTKKIIDFLRSENKRTPIIFTSSIHAVMDNDYGKSKRLAEGYLFDYEKDFNAPVYILRLSNTFGRWARPNMHSVVATFCYNISHGLPIEISDPNKVINLIYIDDVVDCFLDIIEERTCPSLVKKGGFYEITKVYPKSLQELANYIISFKKNLKDKNNITDEFENRLLETYLSYKEVI